MSSLHFPFQTHQCSIYTGHCVFNTLQKSCDKHLNLLFTLPNKHKSEVSLFSYTCEHIYVYNIYEKEGVS